MTPNIITIYPTTVKTPANAAYVKVVQHGVTAPSGIQMERGNKATDFNVSPYDALANAVKSSVGNKNLLTNSEAEQEFSNSLEIPLTMFSGGETITISFYGKYADAGTESWAFLVKNGSTGSDGTTLMNISVKEKTYTYKYATITLPATLDNLRIECFNNGAYAYHGFLKLIKVELGEFPTPWTIPVDEIKASIADATIAKAKTDGRTLVEGGVVETMLILLGLGGIAGLSGIPKDASNNPLPSRWAGGTYQNAIDKVATIIEWFSGDAKYGDFWIDSAGSICIKDSSGIKRVVMTRNDIVTLASIASTTQNTTVNNIAHTYSGTSSETTTLASNIVVNNNNSNLNLVFTLNTSIYAINPTTSRGMSDVYLYLHNTATNTDVQVGQVGAACLQGVDDSDSWSYNINLNVAAGTYQLVLSIIHRNYNNCTFSSGISNSVATVTYDGSYQRTEIGKNGIGIVKDASNYSFTGVESNTYKVVEKVTGVYNRPGILLCGDVLATTTPTFNNVWGATSATASITKYTTGVYRINHGLGFTPDNAVANAKVKSGSNFIIAMITAKTSSYVEVSLGYGTTAVDVNFEFCITGNNQ